MSVPTIQPIATRSGLPLAGSFVKPQLIAPVDVVSGPDTGRPVVGADRTWDDGTTLFRDAYPADVRADRFGVQDLLPQNSMNPSDIRVTTRGIPV